MSDLVKNMAAAIKGFSVKDCEDALKVTEEQIEMNIANIRDVAPGLDGHTEAYRQWHVDFIEKRRHDIAELEEVKRLLKAKINA
jgi:hypothetical protein